MIIYAVKLLKIPRNTEDPIRIYAYSALAVRICMVSIIFIIFPLIWIPIIAADILLGVTFLRSIRPREVEFV